MAMILVVLALPASLLTTETRYAGCYAFGTGDLSLQDHIVRDAAEVDHHAPSTPVKRAGEGAPPSVVIFNNMNFNKISILRMQEPA